MEYDSPKSCTPGMEGNQRRMAAVDDQLHGGLLQMLDQWAVQAFQAHARALPGANLNTKGSEIQMLAYAEEIHQESTEAKP